MSELVRFRISALWDIPYEAHATLSRAQRDVLAHTMAQVLTDLGYSLSSYADDRGVALWARAGDKRLGIVVQEGGQMTLDTVGFCGHTCEQAIEQLVDALAQKGIEIRREATFVHADPRGGALLTDARKTGLRGPAALLEAVAPAGIPPANGSQRGTKPSTELTRHAPATGDRRQAAVWLWAQQQLPRRK